MYKFLKVHILLLSQVQLQERKRIHDSIRIETLEQANDLGIRRAVLATSEMKRALRNLRNVLARDAVLREVRPEAKAHYEANNVKTASVRRRERPRAR